MGEFGDSYVDEDEDSYHTLYISLHSLYISTSYRNTLSQLTLLHSFILLRPSTSSKYSQAVCDPLLCTVCTICTYLPTLGMFLVRLCLHRCRAQQPIRERMIVKIPEKKKCPPHDSSCWKIQSMGEDEDE